MNHKKIFKDNDLVKAPPIKLVLSTEDGRKVIFSKTEESNDYLNEMTGKNICKRCFFNEVCKVDENLINNIGFNCDGGFFTLEE